MLPIILKQDPELNNIPNVGASNPPTGEERAARLFIKDHDFNRDRLVYGRISSREDVEYLVRTNHLHPEAVGLVAYRYPIAGTINYGPVSLRADSITGEAGREQTIRKLLNRFRVTLGLRGRDFIWAATTEFGYENRPHGHFLVSFDRVTSPTKVPSYTTCCGLIPSILNDLAVESGEPSLGTVIVEPVTNSPGAVAYLCKEEFRRSDKAFYYSTGLVKR